LLGSSSPPKHCSQFRAHQTMGKPPANMARGTKRRAVESQAVDPVAPIVAAFDGAEGLPDACLGMLRAMAPSALGTPAEARHACQNSVVAMVSEVLAGIDANLEICIAAADTKAADAVADQGRLEAAWSVADAELAQKHKDVELARSELERLNASEQDAQADVAKAMAKQSCDDECLRSASAEKEKIEKAIRDNFAPLRDGTFQEASVADHHISALLPICNAAGLAESLVTPFPKVARKALDARTSFDHTALGHLERGFFKHIEGLSEKVSARSQGAAESTAAVQVALANLDVVKVWQQAGAAALAAASLDLCDATGAVSKTHRDLNDVLPSLRKLEKDCNAARKRLAEFRQGPYATFRRLQTWSSPGNSDGGADAAIDGRVDTSTAAERMSALMEA